MGFVLSRAAFTIAGAGRESIASVIDAHLETLSIIFLSTLWAVGYGWVEGTIDIGSALAKAHVQWFGRFSTYHLVLGLTMFAISFSFGFLKFTRMLYFRKRYMLFAALGNWPYALVVQDISYFFFAPSRDRLEGISWTCQGLGLGCFQLKLPWSYDLPLFVPAWYFVALSVSAVMFFLAYRSALVNLLVTREVVKQVGFTEKFTLAPRKGTEQEPEKAGEAPPVISQSEPEPEEPSPLPEPEIARIVDAEREELIRRLRDRLART